MRLETSGQHEIHGPYVLTGEDVRVLLASGPHPPATEVGEANNGYGITSKGARQVRITDPALRAIAEGQGPQHHHPPGPPNPAP
jgi:hypothetical protein